MLFRFKSIRATHQRMINKTFQEEIGETLEWYIDDMIIESNQEELHSQHLQRVFKRVRKYNMHLKPEKRTFGVRAGKLWVSI